MSSRKSKKKIVSCLLIIIYLTIATGCRTMMKPGPTEVRNWLKAVDPNCPEDPAEREKYALYKEADRTYIPSEKKNNPHRLFNGGGKVKNPVNNPSGKENLEFPKQMEVNDKLPPIPKEEPVKPKRGWIFTVVVTVISAIAIGLQDVPQFAITVVQTCKGGC